MNAISDIKIIGVDEERPPRVRKEAYIDLFFKLSHKAPVDWCEDFNKLGHQINPAVKIDVKTGVIMETWVREMGQIQRHLNKIKEKIKVCNDEYIEKQKQKLVAAAQRDASETGQDGKQNKLNLIVAELNYD